MAVRAVEVAKQAEFSNCPTAVQSYFEARRNLEIAERYFADENKWSDAEEYYAQARALGEKSEEEYAFCASK